jgi:hypothetical protein
VPARDVCGTRLRCPSPSFCETPERIHLPPSNAQTKRKRPLPPPLPALSLGGQNTINWLYDNRVTVQRLPEEQYGAYGDGMHPREQVFLCEMFRCRCVCVCDV